MSSYHSGEFSDYRHQRDKKIFEYSTSIEYGEQPRNHVYFPGQGMLMGNMSAHLLSVNSIDIENQLLGIDKSTPSPQINVMPELTVTNPLTNKKTFCDNILPSNRNSEIMNYATSINYGEQPTNNVYFPDKGILMGNMSASIYDPNSIDTESHLFGIDYKNSMQQKTQKMPLHTKQMNFLTMTVNEPLNNKTSVGDSILQDRSNKKFIDYRLEHGEKSPSDVFLPGKGLLPGAIPASLLSQNSIDIENQLFGIDMKNSMTTRNPIHPEMNRIDMIDFIESRPVYDAKQWTTDTNQRPHLGGT